VTRFHAATVRGFLELLGAMGLSHPREIGPHHIFRRISDAEVHTLAECHDFVPEGALLSDGTGLESWRDDWKAACRPSVTA
jgi:hypothetical protein